MDLTGSRPKYFSECESPSITTIRMTDAKEEQHPRAGSGIWSAEPSLDSSNQGVGLLTHTVRQQLLSLR